MVKPLCKITWTRGALDWLHDIHQYIALDSPGAARRTVDAIKHKTAILKTFPESGLSLLTGDDRNYRYLLYGHYRIVYRYRRDEKLIEIIAVLHGKLELRRHLP